MKSYRTLLLIFTTLFLSNLLYSQVDTAWVRRYNGPGNGWDGAKALAIDGAGNVYVTGGSYASNINEDYLTIKYNSVGETLWVSRYNGTGNYSDKATAIAVDNLGNVYVTGMSNGLGTNDDYVTIKYNSVGETLWVRRYNSPGNYYDWAFAIEIDSLGNVYVTGNRATIKYNSTGEILWVNQNNGRAIAVDNFGNAYVTGPGYTTIKYSSVGETLWVRNYNGDATALAVDGSGNVYVTGYSYGSGTSTDYATIKYNSAGETLWVRRYNGPGNYHDEATALAIDGSGNTYVTGKCQVVVDTGYDYATIKYNSAGETLWVRLYDGLGNYYDEATSIAVDGLGNVYVTGYSYGSSSGYDYTTIKYNSVGETLWVRRYNGPGNSEDVPSAIAVDGLDNIYVTGTSYGSGSYGDYATIKYTQYQYMNDVGCTKIVTPTGVIDSGTVVTPTCSVYNYGTNSANYRVRMKIGSFYNDTVIVTGQASNTYRYLTFSAWTVSQLGTHIVRCSTELIGDERTSNDRRIDSVMVIAPKDVGTIAILSPSGTIDSGAVITPQARVKNFGNSTVSFPVIFRIGTFYVDTGYVSNLNPNDSTVVSFGSWQAVQRGTHTTKCTTALTGDINPANDFLSGTVTVRVIDVGVYSISAPKGVIDSGTVVTPSCSVYNYGTTTESYPVGMKIGSFYNDTAQILSHTPGTYQYIQFNTWTATQVGTHAVSCSTELATDLQKVNDKRTDSVVVMGPLYDVGVYSISAPKGVIDSGTVVTPSCSVYNYGTTTESYLVRMKIGNFYNDTAQVLSHTPGTYQYIQFPAWAAIQPGVHMVSCSTELYYDEQASNDKQIGSVTVIVSGMVVDVGVTKLIAPTGWVNPGFVITPACSVYNFGNLTMTYPVRMKIGTFYNQVESVFGHLPGTAQYLTFPIWTATQIGMHWVSCSTELDGDMQTTNDKITDWVMVMQACPSWNKLADVSGATKSVKDGGCLTAMGDKVYGLVGNNTQDFMVYDINTYTWTKQGEVPFTTASKSRQKKIKKGACITNDGQYVYIIKGNNTQEFYRYDHSKDAWQELAQPGFSKRIKGGSMAYNGDSLIYLIGGSNRNEWKVYNINSGKWIDANPSTLPADKWKYGSFIVYADGKIFALRGGSKTNEFYKLDLTSPAPEWQAVQSMPLYGLTGRRKKAKKGAAGAYDGNLIFALKGGNTLEYFSYNPKTDTWKILENVGNSIAVPTKKVKGGGSLTYSVQGKGFYGYIGNNTNDFWYYFPDTVTTTTMTSNVMEEVLNSRKPFSLQINPNPTNNLVHISYTLPLKTEAKLKLYNVIGNLVYQAKNNNGQFIINTERLTTGIYIAKFEAGDYRAIKKLIITR